MRCVFTIVTNSHIPQGLAALDSFRKTLSDIENHNTRYQIYTTDNCTHINKTINGIEILCIDDLNLPDYAHLLRQASNRQQTLYEIKNKVSIHDSVRWALKPCLIEHILLSYEECLYLDSDLYFINSVSDIIHKTQNISLSPHFRPYNTTPIFNWMANLKIIGDTNVFTDGYFNGGFLIIKKTELSMRMINWWKTCCLHRCEINKEIGLYVDQKYLDFMYMHFDCIDKINDLGCNIAEWNIYTYQIDHIDMNNNYFIINKQFIPKFFHFSGSQYKHNEIMSFFYQKYITSVNYYRSKLGER